MKNKPRRNYMSENGLLGQLTIQLACKTYHQLTGGTHLGHNPVPNLADRFDKFAILNLGQSSLKESAVFQETLLGRQQRSSGITLAKIMLAGVPGPLDKHRYEVLNIALWKITECEGKWNTPYKSEAAIRCADSKLLRHEHIYQRGEMIKELIEDKSDGNKIDSILAKAVGCVVTLEEALRLNHFVHLYGWPRYDQAGIRVRDMSTGLPRCLRPFQEHAKE